jgi:hypothetical protein
VSNLDRSDRHTNKGLHVLMDTRMPSNKIAGSATLDIRNHVFVGSIGARS